MALYYRLSFNSSITHLLPFTAHWPDFHLDVFINISTPIMVAEISSVA